MGIQNSSRLSSTVSLNNDPQSLKLAASTKNLAISQQPDPTSHRIVWCMYVPDATESNTASSIDSTPDRTLLPEDASKVFLIARKNRIDVFHLGMIEKHHSMSGQQTVDANDLTIGHLIIDEPKSNVLTACFSPDGSAIALSSADGDVFFYRISFPGQLAEAASGAIPESHDLTDSEQTEQESESKP
jgi:hypothetical protein